jgi:hypothetical protein
MSGRGAGSRGLHAEPHLVRGAEWPVVLRDLDRLMERTGLAAAGADALARHLRRAARARPGAPVRVALAGWWPVGAVGRLPAGAWIQHLEGVAGIARARRESLPAGGRISVVEACPTVVLGRAGSWTPTDGEDGPSSIAGALGRPAPFDVVALLGVLAGAGGGEAAAVVALAARAARRSWLVVESDGSLAASLRLKAAAGLGRVHALARAEVARLQRHAPGEGELLACAGGLRARVVPAAGARLLEGPGLAPD